MTASAISPCLTVISPLTGAPAPWLDAVAQRLGAAVPAHRILLANTGVTVPASSPDGFDVAVYKSSSGWVVHMGGWQNEIDSLELAAQLLLEAVSGRIRLCVDVIGGRTVRLRAERIGPAADAWVEIGGFGFVTFDLWRRRRRIVLRNGDVAPTATRVRLNPRSGSADW